MATATAQPQSSIAPPVAIEQIHRLLVADVEPDDDQPRKTFDEGKLAELAESIKVHGVIIPIEVRPNPRKPGKHKLIAGERRWRASKLAGVLDIPALIKTGLSDKQVLERQLVENSQREDVPALEEGEAYKALLDEHGYTMEQLIAKTGRSRTHLYARVQLTKLAPAARKAIAEGKIPATIGELAIRIHDLKLQEQFVREVLGCGKYDPYREAGVEQEQIRGEDDDRGKREDQPLSFRAAATLLRRRYMLRLELAKFDAADAKLTKAGACTTCPKRTGNQPQLPGMEGATKPDDMCTDPACFEEKTGAAWKHAADAAKAKGLQVVDQKKAKMFFAFNDELSSSAPVAAAGSKLPYSATGSYSNETFGKLLGKEIANVPKILVQDPSGAPVELLDKEAALKKLRELGKLKKPKSSSSASSSPKKTKAQRDRAMADAEKQRQKQELGEATLKRALEQVATNAAKDLGSKETSFWRWLAAACASMIGYGDIDVVASRRNLKSHDAIEKLPDTLKTAGELRGLIAEMFVCLDGQSVHGQWGYSAKTKKRFEESLKVFGVDWKKAEAAAKAALEAEAKSDAAKDKKADAKPAKKGRK